MQKKLTEEQLQENENKVRQKMYSKIQQIYEHGVGSKGLILHLINSFIYSKEPTYQFSKQDNRKLICALSSYPLKLIGSKTKNGNTVPEKYIAIGSNESSKVMSLLALEELKKFAENNKIVSHEEYTKRVKGEFQKSKTSPDSSAANISANDKPKTPVLSPSSTTFQPSNKPNISDGKIFKKPTRIQAFEQRKNKQKSNRVLGELIEGVENDKRLTGKVFDLASLAELKHKLESEGK